MFERKWRLSCALQYYAIWINDCDVFDSPCILRKRRLSCSLHYDVIWISDCDGTDSLCVQYTFVVVCKLDGCDDALVWNGDGVPDNDTVSAWSFYDYVHDVLFAWLDVRYIPWVSVGFWRPRQEYLEDQWYQVASYYVVLFIVFV